MRLRTVDAYLLRLMAKPMMAALAVTLAALLLERVLRLFELLTGKGAPLGLVLAMTLNLVPHYLGLALPAAFAVGIIAVMTSLGSENELDAMEGAGWSIRRIGAIFIFCGAILGVLSLLLFGYLQPYSRYAYQAVKHELVNAAWDARVEAGTFIDAGEGMTISAEEVDPTGRILDRVFVLQKQEGDAERILTAERGVLIPNVETRTLRLRLVNGVAVSIGRTEGELSVSFDSLTLEREFDLDGELFRPRGGSERELTQKELLARIRGDEGAPPDPRYAAEFHGRLIRAFALLGVPLIAVPLAVAGKRSPAWRRIALAMAVLIAFQNVTKTVEGMAANGTVDPVLGLWGLCAVYFAFGLWLFFTTASQGTDSALRKCFVWIDRGIHRATGALKQSGAEETQPR
ncbi:YjgP/YjgQ family permease [Pikeienuella piscinae]|uniref:YjgP/YjgQ family permease n=1 Tax=Pikeienuella piscinae TaxID=2748098 RepID=A0A7L5BYA6_9RHOB|nr:LptF/LptG family permease [Pikeienuella piscinae]QIE56905.1 YjgP/YjgQ family permease [Pikeienuella piscinae]